MTESSHFTAEGMRRATIKAKDRQAEAAAIGARRRADAATRRHEKARQEAIALFPKYQALVQSAADSGESKTAFDIRLDRAAAWFEVPTEDEKALLQALVTKFKELGFRADYELRTDYGTGSDPGPPSHRCDLIVSWEKR